MEAIILTPESLLNQVGATEDDLRDAVYAGEVARRNATALDVPARGGFDAWAEANRVLREALVPRGWAIDQSGSFPVIRSDRKVAIIVQAGDQYTGRPSFAPRSKNPKGLAVEAFVRENRQQLSLFPEDREIKTTLLPGTETWVLLIASDGEEARSELSLPAEIDPSDGRIIGWKYRILLPPIDLGPAPAFGPVDDTGPIDFEVTRKATGA